MTTSSTVDGLRAHFDSGATLPVEARLQALQRLSDNLLLMKEELLAALQLDLGKSRHEATMTEWLLLREDLSFYLRQLPRMARTRAVRGGPAQWPGRCSVRPEPRGVVLVISPWNYPLLLSLQPLLEAVAAGNTVLLKPSAQSPATSAALRRLVERSFDPGHAAVLEAGRAEASDLLQQRYDHIFFTGSPATAVTVLRQAAPHLTPVTLELGGKSPCIVDSTAALSAAARRIVFGKFLNAGQTCIAPDYLLVQRAVKDRLVTLLVREIRRQYGPLPLESPDYGSIVNDRHMARLRELLEGQTLLLGGGTDGGRRLEPTLVDSPAPDSPLMAEEIFGPILPILTYDTPEEALAIIARNPTPLALYVFTRDRSFKRRMTESVSFGGGCVNDTILHMATTAAPFGGVGHSGFGRYHGGYGFETFSHWKTLLEKPLWPDNPLRYSPATRLRQRLTEALADRL